MSVWHLADYMYVYKEMTTNMACDLEQWGHFTITSTVQRLHTD